MKIETNIKNYPGLKIRKKAEIIVELWVRPSFSATVVWAVLMDENQYFVRRIVSVTPSEKYQIKPNIFGSETELEENGMDQILGKLREIRIKPFDIGESFGLDGTVYEVKMNRFIASSNISWWSSENEGWSELREWFSDSVSQFQSKLPISEYINEI